MRQGRFNGFYSLFLQLKIMNMTLILNIETATHICSVSLSQNGETIAYKENSEDKTHAELLTVFISELFENSHLSIKNLSAVAISEGPGSYTGLRIGTSVAKGICFGLNIPLISISTLEAMAFGALDSKNTFDLYCPMIDARRMEVYCSIFNSKRETQTAIEAKIIDEDFLKNELEHKSILFFGTGAEKCRTALRSKNAHFTDGVYISSKHMSKIAFEKYLNKKFVNLAYFEPFYLKEFQALKSEKKYF